MTTKNITFSQALVKVTDSNPNATYRISDGVGSVIFYDFTVSDEVRSVIGYWNVTDFGANGCSDLDTGELDFVGK